jgi:hypothetical protein
MKDAVYRREKSKKGSDFDTIGTVEQNRCVDKKDLKSNIEYVYLVEAVSKKGKVSDKSNEAIGALLPVASEKDSLMSVTPPSVKDCIEVKLTQSKFVSQHFIVAYSITIKCETPPSVQLALYRSDDAQWDEKDNLLTRDTLVLPASRGSLKAKNNGEPTTGFLLLKVSTNEDSFVAAKKIE